MDVSIRRRIIVTRSGLHDTGLKDSLQSNLKGYVCLVKSFLSVFAAAVIIFSVTIQKVLNKILRTKVLARRIIIIII